MAAVQLSASAYERLKAEFEDLTTRGRIEVASRIGQGTRFVVRLPQA